MANTQTRVHFPKNVIGKFEVDNKVIVITDQTMNQYTRAASRIAQEIHQAPLKQKEIDAARHYANMDRKSLAHHGLSMREQAERKAEADAKSNAAELKALGVRPMPQEQPQQA